MPAPRSGGRGRRRILLPLTLVVVAAAVALLGPRLLRAHAALQWTRYHAMQAPDDYGQHARGAAQWATRALGDAAPLPWGREACRLALDFGARQELTNRAAALALYERVRTALEATSADRWRGFGLTALLDEARQREAGLRQIGAGDGP